MRSIVSAASFIAALLLGHLGSALAFPLQPIDPVSGAFSGSSPSGGGVLPTPVPIDPFPIFTSDNIDYFGFYIPFQGSYSISANVAADVSNNVTLTSFLLYNSQPDLLPGSAFSMASYQEFIPGKYFSLKPVILARGLYYLGVGATGINPQPPSGYSGTLSKHLSPVPLPASAPMFGVALVTLGVVGFRLQRKKTAA